VRLPEDPDPPLQINIVPMIDVIFAVLIVFILASLFFTRSQELPVDLPNAATGTPQTQQPLEVTIDGNGNLAVNGQPTALPELTATVADLMKTPGTVVIQADKQVPHGRVVAVMDALRTLEGVQLAIATQPVPASSP
jgi:biopolymer transport protein ExbD